jgi:hypothetical protein
MMEITGELVAEDAGDGAIEEVAGEGTADEPLPVPTLATAPQVPLNPGLSPVPTLAPAVVTSSPGSGKRISTEGSFLVDTHPFPRLAKKIPGRAEKATEEAARVPDPVEMVIDAQFM